MFLIRGFILILSVLTLNAAWAINKCATQGGGYVFQDLPCIGKGETIKVMPGSGSADAGTSDAIAKSKKMVADVDWRSKVQEAISSHYPLIGMTRSELDQAMGTPTTVNASNYSGVLKDQIIYRQPRQTWYVYTEQGLVSSIQNMPETNNSATTKPCVSPYVIKEMETSASSIHLGDAERAERLKQIGEAKKCGR
jgi:hypothetical protein